jgi:hypothetical protein
MRHGSMNYDNRVQSRKVTTVLWADYRICVWMGIIFGGVTYVKNTRLSRLLRVLPTELFCISGRN